MLMRLDESFTIGNTRLKNRMVLGPMAGYTDAAFRSLCVEEGAALTYTEMISAKALYYKNKNTKPLLRTALNEGPVVLQLFGNDPELLAQEAEKLQDGSYDIFDINMACPVPKVVNNEEGSALMLQPEKAAAIVKAMVKRLKKPVSVKIRKGFDDEHVNAVQIAKIVQDNGASMIAVHGRTRVQMYHGQADYDIIRQVKEAVSIPVIGSGDIYSGDDARKMLEQTGVDAVMAARGARGNPWIFAEAQDPFFSKPTPEQVRQMILKHLRLMAEYSEPDTPVYKKADAAIDSDVNADGPGYISGMSPAAQYHIVKEMRKHAGFYVAGLPGAASIRREINQCESIAEFERILDKYLKSSIVE